METWTKYFIQVLFSFNNQDFFKLTHLAMYFAEDLADQI